MTLRDAIDAPFRRAIDSQAVAAFRMAYAASGLFYVTGAIQLVDVTWPSRQALLTAAYAVWLCVLALLLVGFKSRAAAVASFALTIVCNSNPFAGAVGELMWRTAGFLLMFMDSGASLSVDELRWRLRGVATPRQQPRWPADLALLSIGLTLLMSGLPKTLDPMWRAGTGFYLAMLLPWTHHPWADFVAGSRALTLVGNYAGILTESLFVFLVFVPMVRWLAIAAFVGLMFGFGVMMSFYFIGAAGISYLPLMLPGADGRWPAGGRRPRLDLLYDAACGVCTRSVLLLRAFDVADRLSPRPVGESSSRPSHGVAPAPAADGIHLVEGTRIYHGFYAWRRFSWTTPYLWAVAPLLHVPGVPQIGVRAYRAVHRRRQAAARGAGGAGPLPAMRRQPATVPGGLLRLFAVGHFAYIAVFGVAATAAVFGTSLPLERLTALRPARVYNRWTNDIRPLPLFCEVHLFGTFVYRLQGVTVTGDTIELLPVFNDRARPGSCCVAGPRYLEGLMFHVTDDAIRMAADPAYRPDVEHLRDYGAVAARAARGSPVPVREVRMLIKLLDPPKTFEGRIAPWDRQPWVPWLRYTLHDGRVTGGPEFLETPPRPSYTVRG